MSYSLRKRIRRRKSKINKRTKITRRFKKSRKQYGGSNPFIANITRLLNEFDFSEREKDELMDKLQRSEWRYNEDPSRRVTLIEKLNETINDTHVTPDEKKNFVNKLFDFWLNPDGYLSDP